MVLWLGNIDFKPPNADTHKKVQMLVEYLMATL